MIVDYVNKGIIELECISTEHNITDIMNMPLQKVRHSYIINMLLHGQEKGAWIGQSHALINYVLRGLIYSREKL